MRTHLVAVDAGERRQTAAGAKVQRAAMAVGTTSPIGSTPFWVNPVVLIGLVFDCCAVCAFAF